MRFMSDKSLGVVMDPIENIHPAKDTTLGLLNAAQRKGWRLFYFEYPQLFLRDGRAAGSARALKVSLHPQRWFELGERQTLELASQSAILMRKDPPVDAEYFYACRILEYAVRAGCPVINDPHGILSVNEKILTQEFARLSVPTIVSRQPAHLLAFVREHKDTVIKPLDNMGGHSVFRIKDSDAGAQRLIEEMCRGGQRSVMMQRLIPEYASGDKRVLLINGAPVPHALNRVPPPGELRANLAAGGRGEVVELTPQDDAICRQIAPRLNRLGLLFVGIDIIGGKLTEINVTSPTCAREITDATGCDVCGAVIDAIEERLQQ